MKRITIEKVIDELKKEADNLLEKWINEGKVFINSNKYYDYSYSKSSSNEIGSIYSKIYSRKARNIYDAIDESHNIFETVIETFKSSTTYRSIINQASLQDTFSKELFENFLAFFLSKYLINETKVNPNFESSIINKFLELIKKRKFEHIETLYVQGIIVEQPIEISYKEIKIIFRKPTLHEESKFVHKNPTIKFPAQSIIDIIYYSNNRNSQLFFKYPLMSVIKLFQINSCAYHKGIEKSFFVNPNLAIASSYLVKNSNPYSYNMPITDKVPLEVFVEHYINTIILIQINKEEKDTFIYSLQVALENYEDCLLRQGMNWKERILYAIMGLEAIWLTENDKETIGFKLKIRVCKILGIIGFDVNKVAKQISIAYSIRSSYAHGSPIKSDIKKKIQKKTISKNDLEKDILEYLRLSIIVGMNILNDNKQSFIGNMNKAIYDTTVNEELINRIKAILSKLDKIYK